MSALPLSVAPEPPFHEPDLVPEHKEAVIQALRWAWDELSREDPDVLREDLDAWRQHTRGPFQVRMLSGDHFFVDSRRAQVVEAVSREIFKHAPTR